MGRRGPAPKPAKLRLLEGARERDINQNAPIPRSGEVVPPDEMSDDVRAIFDYTLAELEHMGIVAPADRDALVAYCEAVDKHRKASALLARSPVLVKGMHGNLVRNPAMQIQRDAAHLIRQFAQEFGLTPSARARIDRDRDDDDGANPFAGAR
jgi:P27 family predicted phage terminase small subunit